MKRKITLMLITACLMAKAQTPMKFPLRTPVNGFSRSVIGDRDLRAYRSFWLPSVTGSTATLSSIDSVFSNFHGTRTDGFIHASKGLGTGWWDYTPKSYNDATYFANSIATNRLAGRTTGGTGGIEAISLPNFTLSALNLYPALQTGSGATNIVSFQRPVGGLYMGGGSDVGAIKILIPPGIGQTMIHITGTLSQYDGASGVNRSSTFSITCYPFAMTSGHSATFNGANVPSYKVRYFNDGTDRYISIGELTQTWTYASVSIDNITARFPGATIPLVASGWAISLITSFTGAEQTSDIVVFPQANPTFPNNVTAPKYLTGVGSGSSSAGTATLSSGTVTINTTAVTANSIIMLSYKTPSGTLASGLRQGTIVAGTSFVISSLTIAGAVNTADNSVVNWWLIN